MKLSEDDEYIDAEEDSDAAVTDAVEAFMLPMLHMLLILLKMLRFLQMLLIPRGLIRGCSQMMSCAKGEGE